MQTKKLSCPSCGVSLKVGVALPMGRKVRCPKCAAGFEVPAEEEERDNTPAPRTRAAKPEPIEDDEPEERRSPRKGRKRPKKAPSKAPLIIGLVVGGLILVGGAGALTFFLKSSKKDSGPVANNAPPAAPPPSQAVPAAPVPETGAAVAQSQSAGQTVYAANNCGRCHTIGGAGGGGRKGKGRTVDLSHVGGNRAFDWISEHIRDPKAHTPESRMPRYEGRISPAEIRALTEYLAGLK